MSELRDVAFTDLLSTIVDNRGRTCPTVESGIPLIATNCIKDDRLNPVFENVRYVSEDTYATWFRGHPEPDDILFVCKGSPGRVALVPDPVPFCIAQDMVSVRADATKAHPRYLYYQLKLSSTREKIQGMHVGTMIPHFKKGDFGRLKLRVHADLAEQQAIAQVLSALDDKIAANLDAVRALNLAADLLFEQIARSTDETAQLGSSVLVTKGVSYKSDDLRDSEAALVTLKSITRDGSYSIDGLKPYSGPYKASQRIASGEIVVAQTDLTQAADVIGRSVRVPTNELYGSLVASLDLAIVRPSNEMPSEFLLGILRQTRFQQHCRSHARGTTVLHLASNAIESYLAPAVSSDMQRAFAEQVAPMHALAERTALESRALGATRDVLLPQLMSGKLRVKDAETMVAAAV